MRGRARSKKIEDLVLKFSQNEHPERPVSEPKISNKGRRRSQIIEFLASQFEKNTSKLDPETSEIISASKDRGFPQEFNLETLETRSVMEINKSFLTDNEVEIDYKMIPIYPEQLYYNKVLLNEDMLKKEKAQRVNRFGVIHSANLEVSELTNSHSPLNKSKTKLDKPQKGRFLDPEEAQDILGKRDQLFVDKMRDTQGNAIQKMKHSFLNQDDRELRKKPLVALKNKISQMLQKEKSVNELVEIYSKQIQNEEKSATNKRVEDWMAMTQVNQRDTSQKEPFNENLFGKKQNLEDR